MTNPYMTCSQCKYFSPNPYNKKVGACMDSAHRDVYDQVKGDWRACSTGMGLVTGKKRRFCPGCNSWMNEDEFVYDRTAKDNLSKLCHRCFKEKR